MKKVITLLCLCLAGCASVAHRPPEPAVHWLRSDDYGEFRGLHVYSQTPDGGLWLTTYPHKSPCPAEAPVKLGAWAEANGVLKWTWPRGHTSTYLRSTNGVYVEQDGKYYVPVELMPVSVMNGKPQLDE